MAPLASPERSSILSRLQELLAQSGNALFGPSGSTGSNINLLTLAVIRWVAVTGQMFTIIFVHFSLGIALPLGFLLAAVAVSAAVNVAIWRARRTTKQLSQARALLVFSFDIIQLGMLLGLTGGLNNPFSVLLLLPVALASTTATRAGAALLTLLTLATIMTLANLPVALPWFDEPLQLPRLYISALWLALSLAVLLLAWYMWQLAEDARRQERAFAAVQLALAREQQLSALGGQAAAVAHALGTPLSTINVIAKELVRETPPSHPLAEEVNELLGEAQRCRKVLGTLGQPSGDAGFEPFTAAPFGEHLREIAGECARPGIEVIVEVQLDETSSEPVVGLPPEIRHSLTNLVENAVTFASAEVRLVLQMSADGATLDIKDDGPGFAPEVLDRLGEPYNSGGHRAGALGLGVFIANSLLARTGATLHFGDEKRGARVRIHWPAGALEGEAERIDG